MKKVIKLLVNTIFFAKYSLKILLLIIFAVFIPIFLINNTIFSMDNLNTIINSDLFSVAGILAGFVFTGLSFIVVSDSEMINNLKVTDNFKIIKNIYINSILSFVMFILLYLIKTIIMGLNKYIIIKIYFSVLFSLFIFGCISFLICLFILSKRISE